MLYIWIFAPNMFSTLQNTKCPVQEFLLSYMDYVVLQLPVLFGNLSLLLTLVTCFSCRVCRQPDCLPRRIHLFPITLFMYSLRSSLSFASTLSHVSENLCLFFATFLVKPSILFYLSLIPVLLFSVSSIVWICATLTLPLRFFWSGSSSD